VIHFGVLWLVGFLFTLVKGKWMNALGSDLLDLDLLTILIACLFLSYGQTTASVFAFTQGLFVDLFSAGLQGIFTTLYLSVFIGIYFGRNFFNLESPKGQVLIIAIVMSMKKIMFIIMLYFFSLDVVVSRFSLWIFALSAALTAIMSPAVFSLWIQVERVVLKREATASEEQL
jgi:hypothetical protein